MADGQEDRVIPSFIPPMLATLVGAPFDDPDWLFEIKWDGFRVEAVVDGDSVRLWNRGEQDASRYFGPFLDPHLARWRRAIVDGEVIASMRVANPIRLLQARIKGRGGAAEPTRSSTRSSTCSTSTAVRCSTNRSRSGADSWPASCARIHASA